MRLECAGYHAVDICLSIVQYEVAKGHILLEHAYPKNISSTPQIWADITLVLETTKSITIAPGTWINVIGYIQAPLRQSRRKTGSNTQLENEATILQAVLIWDAGAIRIGDYEHILEAQRRVERELDSIRY